MQFYLIHKSLIDYLQHSDDIHKIDISALEIASFKSLIVYQSTQNEGFKDVFNADNIDQIHRILDTSSLLEQDIELLKKLRQMLSKLILVNTDKKIRNAFVRYISQLFKTRPSEHPALKNIIEILKSEPVILEQIRSILPLHVIMDGLQQVETYYSQFGAKFKTNEFLKLYKYCKIANLFENNGDGYLHAAKLCAIYPDAKTAFAALEAYANQTGPGGKYRRDGQFVHDACLFVLPKVVPIYWTKWRSILQDNLNDKAFVDCVNQAEYIEAYFKQISSDTTTLVDKINITEEQFYNQEFNQCLRKKTNPLYNQALIDYSLSLHSKLTCTSPSSADSSIQPMNTEREKQLKTYVGLMMYFSTPYYRLNTEGKQGLTLLFNESTQDRIKRKRKVISQIQNDEAKLSQLNQSLTLCLETLAKQWVKKGTPFENFNRDGIIGLSLLYKQSVTPTTRWLLDNGLNIGHVIQFENLDKSKAGLNIPDLNISHLQVDTRKYPPTFFFRKLNVSSDLKDACTAAVLGRLTDCCQSIGGHGETCTIHGLTSPNGGFYVLFRIPDSSDEKYEVLAQSWVWRGTKGELVFDSLEYNRAPLNKLTFVLADILKDFFLAAIENLIETQPDIKCIQIGTGGSTPEILGIQLSKNAVPIDYDAYRDSETQRTLYATEYVYLFWLLHPTNKNKQKMTDFILNILKNNEPLHLAFSLNYLIDFIYLKYCQFLKNPLNAETSPLLDKFSFLETYLFTSQLETQLIPFLSFLDKSLNLKKHLNSDNSLNEAHAPKYLELIRQGALINVINASNRNCLLFLLGAPQLYTDISALLNLNAIRTLLFQKDTMDRNTLFSFSVEREYELHTVLLECIHFINKILPKNDLFDLFETPDSNGQCFITHIVIKENILKAVISIYLQHQRPFPYKFSTHSGHTTLALALSHPTSLSMMLAILPQDDRISQIVSSDMNIKPLLHVANDKESFKILLSYVPKHQRFEALQSHKETLDTDQFRVALELISDHEKSDFITHYKNNIVNALSCSQEIEDIFERLDQPAITILLNLTFDNDQSIYHLAAKFPNTLAILLRLSSPQHNLLAMARRDSQEKTALHAAAEKCIASLFLILDLYPTPKAKLEALRATSKIGNILRHACYRAIIFQALISLFSFDELHIMFNDRDFKNNRLIDSPSSDIGHLILKCYPKEARYSLFLDMYKGDNSCLYEYMADNQLAALFACLTPTESIQVIELKGLLPSLLNGTMSNRPQDIKLILNLYSEEGCYNMLTKTYVTEKSLFIFDWALNYPDQFIKIIMPSLAHRRIDLLFYEKNNISVLYNLISSKEWSKENIQPFFELIHPNDYVKLYPIFSQVEDAKKLHKGYFISLIPKPVSKIAVSHYTPRFNAALTMQQTSYHGYLPAPSLPPFYYYPFPD